MPLYSTGTLTAANEGNMGNGQNCNSGPEGKISPCPNEAPTWCYLFVHRSRLAEVQTKLNTCFVTFVHTSIVYKRDGRRVRKAERPTISGLIFVQGSGADVQHLLSTYYVGLYLVKDCSTGRTAVIPDTVMQAFMQVLRFNPTRIRFMPHAFDYYSEGHTMIRITSGTLAGLEGYRIRISRDKCFITTIGGLTVAIGGIYLETFENIDEYVRRRREQLVKAGPSDVSVLTPLQTEIDADFFTPRTELDLLALAAGLASWLEKARAARTENRFDDVVEILLFLLEEIGSHSRAAGNHSADNSAAISGSTLLTCGTFRNIITRCAEADALLSSLMTSPDVSTDLKDIIATGRESLALRFPFLQIEV